MSRLFCKTFFGSLAALVVLLFAAQVQADLIVNGNFALGDALSPATFTTGYIHVNPGSNPGGTGYPGGNPASDPNAGSWYEGTYTIDTDPYLDHHSWMNFNIHDSLVAAGAPAAQYAMIVNGDATQRTVWSQTLDLVAGQTYKFSAWATSIYPLEASPAQLAFMINGTQLLGSPMTLAGSPITIPHWQEFSAPYTAVLSGPVSVSAIIDNNTVGNGNDFALTDISMTGVPVPEPSRLFGLIGLAGMGLVGLVWRRRK